MVDVIDSLLRHAEMSTRLDTAAREARRERLLGQRRQMKIERIVAQFEQRARDNPGRIFFIPFKRRKVRE